MDVSGFGTIDRLKRRVLGAPLPIMRLTILVSCLLALAAPAFAQAPASAPAPPTTPATPDAPVVPAPAPAEDPAPAPAEDSAAPPPSSEPPASATTSTAAPAEEGATAPAPEGAAEQTGAQGAAPELSPPSVSPLALPGQSPALPVAPDPGESAKMLEQAAPPPVPDENRGWTAPETVFQLHGYFRLRGNLLKNGWLGHSSAGDRLYSSTRSNYDPFMFFQPADRRPTITDQDTNDPDDGRGSSSATSAAQPVLGGCGEGPGNNGRCDKKSQVSGDMRLRLKPEVHLSDDVRVKAWLDVLDNVGAGTMGYGPNALDPGNTIRVRRVWGEARNRDVGELRFGRMGADWGLGILDNGGDRYGIDSDFSSDVDRVMGITNLGGFYFMAAYDWASEGDVMPGSATPSGVPIDNIQSDDLDAFTFSIAHRLEPEAQQSALLRGEAVFNYGAYFIYRDQLLQGYQKPASMAEEARLYARLDQTEYVPDLWLQFLWEGLRVEVEAAYHAGQIEGACPSLVEDNVANDEIVLSDPTGRSGGNCKLRQLGVALETEYRLFDDRLGLYFFSGFSSGDTHARGLAATNDPALQRVAETNDAANDEITTYQFHPDYRVDMILWRTLMRRVAGAYYFKPGLSYDFIRDPYGQQAGGRFDLVYSRASRASQTWGDSSNLGLELDISLYYRSEDGPDIMDGFYGMVQWGVLFPFRGLQGLDADGDRLDNMNAMMFRGVAGVSF
jgi:uncharacterized protein (TIGR04551 family)